MSRALNAASVVRAIAAMLAVAAGTHAETAAPTLPKGAHVCLVGGALPERMQHDGWLETFLHAELPEHRLVFRNLGYSADTLAERPRTDGFGSPDEYLARCKADVVLAFWGFNESFKGDAGIVDFMKQLEDFIRHTRGQHYNGTEAPQLVLVSPIAHERIGGPSDQMADANNARLALYTDTMRSVAASQQVAFVDLFTFTRKAYEADKSPWTINGIHLNERGNRAIAAEIASKLLGRAVDPDKETRSMRAIRSAVRDRNAIWFHRYRVPDGYNVYGGRSKLSFKEDISNFQVMMREQEIRDAMAAQLDQKVWSACGDAGPFENVVMPEPLKIKSNRDGGGPDGTFPFLDPVEAISRMTLASNLNINLFASEKEFKELRNPVQMEFDAKGRLWAAVWPSYTSKAPGERADDMLVIFEDTDGDGRADRRKIFASGLQNPTGFTFWNGGVFLAAAPDIVFLKDLNGDDIADVTNRVLHGISSSDTHHTANSFVIGPDGGLYFQEGVFHRTSIESPYGPVRNVNGAVWRFDPLTWRVERYAPYNFANPHGHSFNAWGQNIIHDGTGADPYHGLVISAFRSEPGKHGGAPNVYKKRIRPCPGTTFLSSPHFPEDWQENLLVCNVIGDQGILRYKIEREGSTYKGTELKPMLLSKDPNFRPVDIETGPDGALYLIDWQNPLIGHMQHHVRDPNRDRDHGRIYRITYADRPLSKPSDLTDASIAGLLESLVSSENQVKFRAMAELSARDPDDVLSAANTWMKKAIARRPEMADRVKTEVLWLQQQRDRVDARLLSEVLAAKEPLARAAAARVLRWWQTRVDGGLDLLGSAIKDPDALVRAEALAALSYSKDPAAAGVARSVTNLPVDSAMDYVLKATLAELDPRSSKTVAPEEKVRIPKGIDRKTYLLGKEVYEREAHCATCHQPHGKGMPKVYPPLDASPWVTGDKERLIKLTLNGLWGPIQVLGESYENAPPMTAFKDILSDQELAAVLTYVRNTWSNKAEPVTLGEVRKVREATKGRTMFWKPEELLKDHPLTDATAPAGKP